MSYLLLGLNHKTAPLAVRERLAIPEHRLAEAVGRLVQHPGVTEGMILSTCNRTELLTHTLNGSADLREFLKQYFQLEPVSYEGCLYEHRGLEAVRHVFRVTASLDSMVLGEPQILGQVKDAYALARSLGAVNANLESLLSRAFTVAKKVRSETAIGASAVSVASVAVQLAEQIFGSLAGKNVYLVGAGKMSELAARHFKARGAGSIFVSNRTHEKAVELAETFGGQAILFEQLYEHADRADIIVTSTGAPHAIFRREHGEMFLHRRKNRPMFFIDIAVPRDVDPAVNKLDNIFVYDIDDLQAVVAQHLTERQREAGRALTIVDAEVERFQARLQEVDVVPTIVDLQQQLESIRQGEVDRLRSKLGQLSPEQEQAVEALTRGIVNKILHPPLTTLKSAARESANSELVATIRRVFNLDKKDSGRS